jgi:hypothetical protein
MGRKSRNRAPSGLANTAILSAPVEPAEEESPITLDEPTSEPAEVAAPSPFLSVTVVTGLHHNGAYYEPGSRVSLLAADALSIASDGAVKVNGLLLT